MNEIVKCENCEYCVPQRSEESAKKFGQIYDCKKGIFLSPRPNDFCSKGKRKEKKEIFYILENGLENFSFVNKKFNSMEDAEAHYNKFCREGSLQSSRISKVTTFKEGTALHLIKEECKILD